MILFDGIAEAGKLETQLKQRVGDWLSQGGVTPTIAAILFREDAGSQLYTRLKREAAQRVGIEYQTYEFSLTDPPEKVIETISKLNSDQKITGIIVQKPWRKLWLKVNETITQNEDSSGNQSVNDYNQWWQSLMSAVDPVKDVDGLHPQTLVAVEAGTWQKDGYMLPATCRAVLYALDNAKRELNLLDQWGKTIIIGRTDLLGIPLYHVLQQEGIEVELIGIRELAERVQTGQLLLDAKVIVSATGQRQLVNADMINDETVLIDVGEPQPDIDQVSVQEKASFLTPVPGGIGPLTVSFLLDNALQLAMRI